MNIRFECSCGEDVSGSTRSTAGEVTCQMRCDDCGEMYAVTITPMGAAPDR